MKNFRIYFRALEVDDYKKTINWRNDNEIWAMVAGPKYFVSTEYERQWVNEAINSNKNIRLGICLKESDELIGISTISDIDWINKKAHCHFMIGEKKHWNKRLGTEALILLLQFAFYERNFQRISANILESNIGSLKMFKKCGFIKEGFLRKSIYKSGKYHNQVVMSILREEFDIVIQKYELE